MQSLILFGSTRRSTSQLVTRLKVLLKFKTDTVNVSSLTGDSVLDKYDLLIFCAPTYGDGELQDDMESFLLNLDRDLSGKYFATCELGNYYGYDDFTHGAMPIMRTILKENNAEELIAPVSIDSLPKKDWRNLEHWSTLLNRAVADV